MKIAVSVLCSVWGASLLWAEHSHWAFQPLAEPPVPKIEDASWVENEIDHFVRARQQAVGLIPNPEADRQTLIRRATFDLVGLPPTLAEIDAFVNDRSPDAYEKLVDRLLASPHYGERWGRHWLDVVRYADSMGYRFDDNTPNAYQYRDFVIRALNEDLPFDEFVRWQLAGDELSPDNPVALAATGFAAVGPRERIEGTTRNRLQTRYDEMDDLVSTTSSAFLALTANCARCHDHKSDPISQREYYGMVAAFLSGERRNVDLITLEEKRMVEAWERREDMLEKAIRDWKERNAEKLNGFLERRRDDLEEERVRIIAEFQSKLSPTEAKNKKALPRLLKSRGEKLLGKKTNARRKSIERLLEEKRNDLLLDSVDVLGARIEAETIAGLQRLADEWKAHQKAKPLKPEQALVYVDRTRSPVPSPLLDRGSIDSQKDPVPLGFVRVLTREGYQPDRGAVGARKKSTYQRAALARWMTNVESGAGAQLGRVMVNRMWLHHFGEGLVRTPNDFGTKGDKPLMPELLDWLARRFIEGGWSQKEMHRHMVTSAVYRQSSKYDEARAKLDPENRLFHRRRPVRLEAEILRDSILSVSGKLERRMFGKPMVMPVPEDLVLSRLGQAYPKNIADGPAIWRRSVYAMVKRTVPEPMHLVFDGPNHSESCGRRATTTVAPQALFLMNADFMERRSRDFAERVRKEAGEVAHDQIRHAYRLALGRRPSEFEEKEAIGFLRNGNSLGNFCQVLFTLNEFLYID